MDRSPGYPCARRAIFLAAAVCVILMTWHSLTRTLYFSPDSFVYMDTALSLAGGHGFSRGVQQWHELKTDGGDLFHAPEITYAPLYPLAVAALVRMGVGAPAAALLVAAFGYAATLAGLYLLCRRLYGEPAGLLVIAVLLPYLPFSTAGACAWSESLALACLVFGFLALAGKPAPGEPVMPASPGDPWKARIEKQEESHNTAKDRCSFLHSLVSLKQAPVNAAPCGASLPVIFLAGLCLGLAVTTRYALLPAAGFGLATVIIRARQTRRAAYAVAAYLTGVTAVVGPLLVRNYLICGRLLGAERPPSERGLLENLHDVYAATFQSYLPAAWLSPDTQARLLLASLVALAGAIVLRRRARAVFDAAWNCMRWILPAWALLYLTFLVVYRTLYLFDPVSPRLALPGLLFLIPMLAAATLAAIQPGGRAVAPAAAAFAALAVCHAVYALSTTPHDSIPGRVARSERLTWVAENTTPEDVIIGDMLIDLPAYCGPRRCLSFFPLEAPRYHLTADGLSAFLKPRLGHFEKAYIVVRRIAHTEPAYEQLWRRCCGDFVADLVYGRPLARPGVRRAATLKDGQVFEVDAARFVAGP